VLALVWGLPQHLISRAWGWLARRRSPKFAVTAFKKMFAVAVGIDMSEALHPMEHYDCLESLFVRQLRQGVHQVSSAADAFVCPIDGTMGASGRIRSDTAVQAKGMDYSIRALLAGDASGARYEGGYFATFYLSPRDYHRIHSPCAGEVAKATLVPGKLLPVFPAAVEGVDGLFARNERLVTYVQSTNCGIVAVVKVGATMVGRITAAYDDSIATNSGGGAARSYTYDPAYPVTIGGELGTFELGSTVVICVEANRIQSDFPPPGAPVRMGQQIARITAV
jgi:phosphatidylserine decarboxylase